MGRIKILVFCVILALSFILFILTQGGCKHSGPIYSNLDAICFERDILPIFTINCGIIGCHDRQSAFANYVFIDYSSISKGVIPFNPEKSIAYRSIIGKEETLMPPGHALSESERILIRVWIGQGAANTTCTAGFATPEKPSQTINNFYYKSKLFRSIRWSGLIFGEESQFTGNKLINLKVYSTGI
jgi:hypothetical protein